MTQSSLRNWYTTQQRNKYSYMHLQRIVCSQNPRSPIKYPQRTSPDLNLYETGETLRVSLQTRMHVRLLSKLSKGWYAYSKKCDMLTLTRAFRFLPSHTCDELSKQCLSPTAACILLCARIHVCRWDTRTTASSVQQVALLSWYERASYPQGKDYCTGLGCCACS